MINAASSVGATMVDDVDLLDRDVAGWDALAVRTHQPYAAPQWCLAWWRHVAPPSARLRVILVRDGDSVMAVAPFYCDHTRLGPARYRLLGSGTSPRLMPLVSPGTEVEAARHIAAALAEARPRPDVIELDGVPSSSRLPELIADAWPGRRARVERSDAVPAPGVTIVGTFDEWLGAKSRNFRQQTRRHRRRLTERGATFHMITDPQEACARLDDFARLHEARWRYRGGSGVLNDRVMHMLRDTAQSMTASGRLRLHLIEAPDTTVAAHIMLAAGGELTYWLGGFDEEWGAEQPSLQALVDVLSHAFENGDRRFDLGPGAQAYKNRLSDHQHDLCAVELYPPGRRQIVSLATRLPPRLATTARQRLFAAVPTERKNQVKRWLRRVRG